MRKVFKVLLLLTSTAIFAEETPPVPCSANEHRQFDFWLGHWTSYSKEGKKQGTNHLTKFMGQCVIQENWQSGGGKFKGTSFNFYDPARKEWHQTWVDSSGGTLRLDGGLVGGSMQLSGQRTESNGDTVVERITWIPLEDGRVRQHWQASTDEGENWTEVFDGYYQRDED